MEMLIAKRKSFGVYYVISTSLSSERTILLPRIFINGFEFNELKYTKFIIDFTHTILDTSKKNIYYTLHYIIWFKN